MEFDLEKLTIPDGWKIVCLSEVSSITTSNVDKKVRPSELQISLCNYMDVYSNDYLNTQTIFSRGSVTNAELLKFKLLKEDVIITKDSETPDDIAIPSVVIEDLNNVVCGYHLALIRPNSTKIKGQYLSKALLIELCRRHFANSANGSTRYGLTQKAIYSCPILLPSIEEQEVIASILLKVDQAIEKTEQLIAKYEHIKTGLMQDLLTHGIDEKGNIRREETHAFKDSALGRIPVEWEVERLGSLCEFVSGKAWSTNLLSEYGKKIIRISNLHKPDFPFWRYNSGYKQDMLVRNGDVLFSWAGVASSIDCVRYFGEDALLNQHIYNLKFGDTDIQDFAYRYINWFLPSLRREIEGGAGQLHLTKDKIQGILVPIPKKQEMVIINRKLELVESIIAKEQAIKNNLVAEKKALMQDLLTGKKRVDILMQQEKAPQSI